MELPGELSGNLFEECEPETQDEPSLPIMDDRVLYEIHRITGFLRFSAGSDGVYIARCSPDFFILPALAEHFYLRFGEAAWAVIDEKRNLCLYREKGKAPRLVPSSSDSPEEQESDYIEDLWRLYHRSINNEARKNLRLQRQFIPERYRKYLTELK
jgi:probable DNA metabolism protein